jgi:23S rRNA (cytosine1962-C5)-methyltransferase
LSIQPSVTITKRGLARVEAGHLWIYRSDVHSPPALDGGEAVRVLDERGKFIATAFFSSKSQITLRLLSRTDAPADVLIAERLKLAVDLRARVYPNDNAVRLVHGEGDLLPGLVVDRYGSALSIQTLTAAMEQRQAKIVEQLVALTGATTVVARNDVSARRHEGLPMTKAVLFGPAPGPIEYREGDITLIADLMEGQKTGAFLDQRENHVHAGLIAYGRALDCFAYQGGFSLQLARRAESVTAVDSSDKAIADLKVNAARNQITNVEGVIANAFDFLRTQADRNERYDVIVLDPPAFTKSKDSIDAALRGYKEINLRALSMLKPGGLLITSSCSFHVDEAQFAQMLLAAAHDAGRAVQLLEKRGAGRDHPEMMGVPETKYLKCFFVRAIRD